MPSLVHRKVLAIRNPSNRNVGCPRCSAGVSHPCIGAGKEFGGMELDWHHYERLVAAKLADAFPVDALSPALRFSPFHAWLRNPMLYGPICVLVMAALATGGRTYIYDLHDRLRAEDALTVGGIVILGISCGWYAQMMGCQKFVWVNRLVSVAAFVIAVASMVSAF